MSGRPLRLRPDPVCIQLPATDVLAEPYHRRRFIIVRSEDAILELQTAERSGTQRGVDDSVIGAAAGGVLGYLVVQGVRMVHDVQAARSAPVPVLVLSPGDAQRLDLPGGRPLHDVVHVADPKVDGRYHPLANFHRYLFESKRAEATRLLRCLGATNVSVEYIHGFEQGLDATLTGSTPAPSRGDVSARGGSKRKVRAAGKSKMTLAPTTSPQIPSDMVWFDSEPAWQELASARLESDLRHATMTLSYSEDFGVNADINLKIDRVGLKGGGKFTDFQETIWKLEATFGPMENQSVGGV